MLLPGPEAQQLATYIGWLMHRTRGGIIAGGLFVLPGIVAIMGLSCIYAAYGNVGLVAALFFGLKAAVLAVVLQAVVRIGRRALKNRRHGRASRPLPSSAIFLLRRAVPDRSSSPPASSASSAGALGWPPSTSAAATARPGTARLRTPTRCWATSCPRMPGRPWRGRCAIAAVWLLLWLVPVVALLAHARAGQRLQPTSPSSSRRWRW